MPQLFELSRKGRGSLVVSIKKAIGKWSLFFLALCLCLGCFEIGFRVWAPVRFSSFINSEIDDWLHGALKESSTLGYDLPFDVTAEDDGVNDSGESFRVICVGDSTTDASSYVDFLQKKLNSSQHNLFDVHNCGVSGYGIFQYCTAIQEKWIDADPNLIVIGFCLNDFVTTPLIVKKGNTYSAYWPHKEILPFVSPFLLRYSYFYRYLFMALYFNNSDNGEHIYQQAEERIRAIKDALDRKEIECLVVIFGYPILFKEYDEIYGKRSYVEIKRILSVTGIDFIDMVPLFEAFGPRKLRFEAGDDIHFNDSASEMIAAELYDYISKTEETLDGQRL